MTKQQRIRGYVVWTLGFGRDPVDVYVRATTRGRARYLCALAFKDAGWGTIGEGLQLIVRTRLDNTADGRPLVSGATSGEGLVCSV